MLRDHPVVGGGLAGFKQSVAPYRNGIYTEDLIYPHNIVLNFWTETGLLGLAAFAWLFVQVVRTAWSGWRDGSPPWCSLQLGILLALVGILVHGLVDVPYLKNDLSLEFLGAPGTQLGRPPRDAGAPRELMRRRNAWLPWIRVTITFSRSSSGSSWRITTASTSTQFRFQAASRPPLDPIWWRHPSWSSSSSSRSPSTGCIESDVAGHCWTVLFVVFGASILAGSVMLALMLLYRGFSFARLVLLYTVVAALILMVLGRVILRQVLIRQQRQGVGTERVLVVGTGAGSDLLIHRMMMFPQYGYTVCGVLDDRMDPGTSFAGTLVVGRVSELPAQVAAQRIDQVFLAIPGATHGQLLHLIKTCEDLNVDFRMLPDLFEIITTRMEADVVDGIPLVGIRRSQVGRALDSSRSAPSTWSPGPSFLLS